MAKRAEMATCGKPCVPVLLCIHYRKSMMAISDGDFSTKITLFPL